MCPGKPRAPRNGRRCAKPSIATDDWANPLGRRNLTDYQRAEVALHLKEGLVKLARERMMAGKAHPPPNLAGVGAKREMNERIGLASLVEPSPK